MRQRRRRELHHRAARGRNIQRGDHRLRKVGGEFLDQRQKRLARHQIAGRAVQRHKELRHASPAERALRQKGATVLQAADHPGGLVALQRLTVTLDHGIG